MAKRKKRKGGRRRRSSGKRKGGYRRRRSGGGGGVAFSLFGRPVYKPDFKRVTWLAIYMVAGELIVDAIEEFTGFDVPDEVPDTAAGLIAGGIWFRDRDAQTFGWALALGDFIDDTEFVQEQKAEIRDRIGVPDALEETESTGPWMLPQSVP